MNTKPGVRAESPGTVRYLDPIAKAQAHPRSLRSAINAKCYDCTGLQRIEVTKCTVTECPLYLVRPWQR